VLAALLSIAVPDQTKFTVFHVNPLHEGVVPVNMDTADLSGDIFFDLRSKTLPIECSNATSAHFGSDCRNEEVVDDDLVISKLTMTVKGRFGEYGRCNACNASDIDPFSGLPCAGQDYLCTCGNYQRPKDCSSQLAVGAENITEQFGQFGSYICNWDNWIQFPWICWGWTVVNKTGGPGKNMWYSSTAAGWCDAEGAGPNCTWSAEVVKIVNKSCSDDRIAGAVEAYDAQHDGRFARCPDTQPGPHRNTSSVCWIYAFYATVLGPEALVPGGIVAGMPTDLLEAAFELPFEPEPLGGCPAIPAPPTPRTAAKAQHTGGVRGRGHRSFGVLPRPSMSSATRQTAFREVAQLARTAVA